jgi:hypothetical protein
VRRRLVAPASGRLFLVISGAASLSLQYANGIGLFGVPGIDPWFWERFRGWSSNPNQLAILCLIIVLVAFYLADAATSVGTRLAAMLLMIPPRIVGRMSRSDAFMLALAVALAVWFAVKLIVWLHDDRLGLSLRASFARLALLAAPVLLLCLAPLVVSRAEEIKGFAMGFAKHEGAEAADEANLRLTLWRQAIGRGIDSGMMGLGPGPHLQIPLSIVAGRASMGTQPATWIVTRPRTERRITRRTTPYSTCSRRGECWPWRASSGSCCAPHSTSTGRDRRSSWLWWPVQRSL